MHIFKGLCITASIIYLLIPTSAKAETWELIDDNLTVDTSNISSKGDLRMYWTKLDEGSKIFKSNQIMDCSSGRYDVLKNAIYNYNTGDMIAEKTYEPGENSKYIIPSSNGTVLRQLVCK